MCIRDSTTTTTTTTTLYSFCTKNTNLDSARRWRRKVLCARRRKKMLPPRFWSLCTIYVRTDLSWPVDPIWWEVCFQLTSTWYRQRRGNTFSIHSSCRRLGRGRKGKKWKWEEREKNPVLTWICHCLCARRYAYVLDRPCNSSRSKQDLPCLLYTSPSPRD